VISETTKHVDGELTEFAQKIILAGEDEFDTMYIPARDLYKFTSEGNLYNLLNYDEFNFNREWWLSPYNNANTINGKLYAAAGYSQLMIVDSIWCLFFNEMMMTDLGIDKPYQLVRDGKWTLDRYSEYLKSGARLNGDNSFEWKNDGKCIYGMSGFAFDKFLIASGERLIESNKGKLTLTAGSEHFFNVITKLASTLTEGNGYARINSPDVTDDTIGNYLNNFEIERALFVTAEISKTSRMRTKTFNFGIVPFPKYDDTQTNYYSAPFYGTPCFTIPITCTTPERSAKLGDALTYLSYDMVMPVFRELTLEQKGLRNDESIEMLNIIINSSIPDLVYTYNIGSTFRTDVGKKLKSGDSSVASIFAAAKSAMEADIKKVNEN
jgi:ABC-type glycerol-3-phosphate transport system substrate-binding protein